MAIDMKALFAGLQQSLASELHLARQAIKHPGDKGAVSELDWIRTLDRHLPGRYCIRKATVVDCNGETSDSIDIVIYDRQFSPLVFVQQDFCYVPAEAVYAIFEVKQTLNRDHLVYAGAKAASVRRLLRTSVGVTDIRGATPRKDPIPILAGLLTTEIDWKADISRHVENVLESLPEVQRLDFVCAATGGAFEVDNSLTIRQSSPETGLAFFIFGLLARLQKNGTVAPIDFDAYRKWL